MKARIFQWLRRRKTLFRMAKRTQSAYIFFHNHVHKNPHLLRKSLFASKSRIGGGTRVHPTAFVSEWGVRIGSNCTVGPSAVILEKVILEDDVEVGPGAVIGSQGFTNERSRRGTKSVRHTGGVRIRRGVRIGANSCVDRSAFRGRTDIGERTLVGSFAHIAHDIRTGIECDIGSHAMVGGRVTLGDGVRLGENCSLSHFLVIGDRAVIKDSAVATRDVGSDQVVEGNFAIDSARFRQFMNSIETAGEASSR
jgi:UDP-3-O-[3-hydroxymyristoyl] glucosamine N-acyltransferase